jgi:hypothetical protein
LIVIWLKFIGLGLLAILLTRIRWWVGLVVLPASVFVASGLFMDLREPYVRHAIGRIGMTGYVLVVYGTVVLGGLFPLLAALVRRHRTAA